MRYIGFFGIIVLSLFISCQNKNLKDNIEPNLDKYLLNGSVDTVNLNKDMIFQSSLYSCECKKYISKLVEIPDRDSNAYRIIIKSKYRNWEKSELINTRPQMSRIIYCSEFYTVVSFTCGMSCHSEVFIFTDKSRPNEQFGNVQFVKNNPNFIVHFRNENFEKLIIRNLYNKKEQIVDISDGDVYNSGLMDSIIMKKNNIELYYFSDQKGSKTKSVNISSLL